jgi:hypothetical protein
LLRGASTQPHSARLAAGFGDLVAAPGVRAHSRTVHADRSCQSPCRGAAVPPPPPRLSSSSATLSGGESDREERDPRPGRGRCASGPVVPSGGAFFLPVRGIDDDGGERARGTCGAHGGVGIRYGRGAVGDVATEEGAAAVPGGGGKATPALALAPPPPPTSPPLHGLRGAPMLAVAAEPSRSGCSVAAARGGARPGRAKGRGSAAAARERRPCGCATTATATCCGAGRRRAGTKQESKPEDGREE